MDGHSSHHSLKKFSICAENGVVLYILKAHVSHLIQPLDQAFFRELKPGWSEAVRTFQYITGESATVKTIARSPKKAWDTAALHEHAFNRFSKSGIFPINPKSVF